MHKLLLFIILLGTVLVDSPVAGADVASSSARLSQPPVSYLQAPFEPGFPEQLPTGGNWQPLPESSPNFGYVTNNYWYRMPVPEGAERQILEISYPQLDFVRFYLLEDGKPVMDVRTGDRVAFDERPLHHPNFLFPYSVDPGKNYEILLAVQTRGAHQVPMTFWQQDLMLGPLNMRDRLHSLYYGILITTILINLIIFIALRETTYLHYVLSTSGYLFLLASLHGFTYQTLWPDHPGIHNQSLLLAVPVTLLLTIIFARSFLSLGSLSPRWDRLLRLASLLCLFAVAGTFLFDFNTSIRASVALAMAVLVMLTLMGPVQWLRGNPQAGYYTVAWSLLLVGTGLAAANKYGLLPNSWITTYGMEAGSALEAMLLTFALARRLYNERQEKIHSRESEIKALEARRQAELKLMDQALHNALTGLPNRTSFEVMLQELLADNPHKRYAVAVMHLNNLQNITKTLGHRNTDRLLEVAARRLNSIVGELPGICTVEDGNRGSFYLASLEAATFGFVIDADIMEQSPRRIMRSLEEIREPIDYLGMELPLDPRTGTAFYPDHARDTNTLIRRAYIAQESQEASEHGLTRYQPTRDSYSADRLTLVSELRQALQENRLALYLQPKMRLRDRTIVSLEALIRWPDRAKPVYPDELVAIAEQTGLIRPLTRWVLEQSLEIRTRLVEQGYPLGISVNISPNNLREPDFPVYVQRLMRSYHSHRGFITLEVTETSMMQDPVNSLKALKALKSAGIPLSIDDFGSGYSSLSYIKQLPASEIKIDRSLVADLVQQSGDRVIVQTTINMCHSLGYTVVAEGVEDTETMDLLASMGCDEIQGYIMTPPLTYEKLLVWLDDYQTSRIASLG